ncbi:MAG: flagellar biosynthetic protein FliR [Candidatus Saccharibacteria bacterium]|nr:flagellar biosynthetic protein FliR [Pseudorhodobacter sp.]
MIPLLEQLMAMTGLGEDWFRTATLVFLRVGAVMSLMPAFGERTVPQRVRLVLTLAFTAIIAPAVVGSVQATQGWLLPAAVEVLVGLAIGIGLRLFIMALQIAAAIIAQVTSLSQLFGGATPDPQPAIGNLLTVAALALAVLSGLHVKAASLLIMSYQILPAGRLPTAADMADWGLLQIANALVLAFSLAAPFVIGSIIYNVALGVINKSMPQLAVSLVGAPLLTFASLLLMALVIPLALTVWMGSFDAFLADPFGSSR